MNGNDRFLNINDAHLRVMGGNVHASSFNLDQISITTTSTTASTIDFLNETTAFRARSNIEVGTANLFVNTETSNVGIRTSSPEYALDVHGPANVSVLTASSNVGVGTFSPEYALDVHGPANVSVLTASSNVGVGTFSPEYALDVHGSANVGALTATTFSGSGAGLTALDAANITTGTLDAARVPDLDAAKITTGTLDAARVPNLDAAKITTGTLDAARVPTPTTFTTATFSGDVTVNTDTFHVDTTNNRVGVGTTSPNRLLDVSDSTGETAMHISGLAGQSNAFIYMTETPARNYGGVLHYSGTGSPQGLRFGHLENSTTPRYDMAIDRTSGNVGIGTTTPTQILDVGSSLSNPFICRHLSGSLHNADKRDSVSFGRIDGSDFMGMKCRVDTHTAIGYGDYANQTRIGFFTWGSNYTNSREAMCIRGDGNVGISRSDPTYTLDVFGNIGICNTTSGKTDQHWSYSGGTDSNTGNMYLRYKASGYAAAAKTRVRGSDANQATLNFTGQHKTYIKDISSERAEELEGLIVSANTNKYMKMSEGVEMGQNAITINESLPIVNISNVSRDKTCFGVISASEDSNDTRGETIGCFTAFIHKEDGDTRVYINSLGEGALWVVNTNGTIESGDYVTTSNIAGYGMKQDSECLMNYTVAKSTMDCDFNPLTQKKRCIVKEQRDAVAWVLRKYEEVSEEEYNNAPEDKRKIEDGTFKIEREYVSRYDPDNEDYIKETRTLEFSVLDENKQLVWEDMDDSELEYKIRYLDANGNITTEENATHKAAFIGCTYHCG